MDKLIKYNLLHFKNNLITYNLLQVIWLIDIKSYLRLKAENITSSLWKEMFLHKHSKVQEAQLPPVGHNKILYPAILIKMFVFTLENFIKSQRFT